MLEKNIIESIKEYANCHLPDDTFYNNLFTFITDTKYRDQIIKEYKNMRFIYKILEGMQAKDDLLYFEAKAQIIMYASIEEAVLSWVLFNYFKNTHEFEEMTTTNTLKKYDIPPEKMNSISKALKHDSKDIIPCFYKKAKVPNAKIRFDTKVITAFQLKIISEKMKDDLIKIYEYRNTVHIEAFLKKNLNFSLDIAKLAYLKVEGLNIELSNNLRKMGLIS